MYLVVSYTFPSKSEITFGKLFSRPKMHQNSIQVPYFSDGQVPFKKACFPELPIGVGDRDL